MFCEEADNIVADCKKKQREIWKLFDLIARGEPLETLSSCSDWQRNILSYRNKDGRDILEVAAIYDRKDVFYDLVRFGIMLDPSVRPRLTSLANLAQSTGALSAFRLLLAMHGKILILSRFFTAVIDKCRIFRALKMHKESASSYKENAGTT